MAGNEAAKGRAALEKPGPQRRHGHQKCLPKPGEKERHASSSFLHSKLLPMTLIGQINQKPIGREARPMCFVEINPLLYKTEQRKQMIEI